MVKYSCQYIDDCLAFNRTDCNSMLSRITYCNCTNPTNGLGRCPCIEEYDGSEFNWNDFIIKRDKLRQDFSNGIFPKECVGCCQIKEQAPKEHHKIYDLAIASWQICNSRCIYCESEYLNKYKDYIDDYNHFYRKFVEQYNIVPIIKEMIDKDILAKEARIDITGGEPTLYPHFEELLALLISNGYKNIRILSNVIMYSPFIEQALKSDSATMIISLDAGTKEMHKKVKGVSSYDLVWENIKRYAMVLPKNSKHDIDLKYILIPNINDSKKELETWLKLSKQNGATCVSVDLDFRCWQKNQIDLKTAKKLMSLCEFIIKKANKFNLRIYFHPNLENVYIKNNKSLPNFS